MRGWEKGVHRVEGKGAIGGEGVMGRDENTKRLFPLCSGGQSCSIYQNHLVRQSEQTEMVIP